MSPAMHPCLSCGRHVRASETSCPFCASAFRAPNVVAAPAVGPRFVSRGALLVAGALAIGGCESTAAAYGGPPVSDPSSGASATATDAAATPATQDASEPTAVVAIYGAPSPQ
jgi:hypothetical protein